MPSKCVLGVLLTPRHMLRIGLKGAHLPMIATCAPMPFVASCLTLLHLGPHICSRHWPCHWLNVIRHSSTARVFPKDTVEAAKKNKLLRALDLKKIDPTKPATRAKLSQQSGNSKQVVLPPTIENRLYWHWDWAANLPHGAVWLCAIIDGWVCEPHWCRFQRTH